MEATKRPCTTRHALTSSGLPSLSTPSARCMGIYNDTKYQLQWRVDFPFTCGSGGGYRNWNAYNYKLPWSEYTYLSFYLAGDLSNGLNEYLQHVYGMTFNCNNVTDFSCTSGQPSA
jgi:hypothetical protein